MPARQAEAALRDLIQRHVVDPDGALRAVLLRDASDSAWLRDPGRPRAALAAFVAATLASEPRLKELVREADVEWGRTHEMRPHFEKQGFEPHPDDPYTIESVRARLETLAAALAGAG
jgi:hypothetical protein